MQRELAAQLQILQRFGKRDKQFAKESVARDYQRSRAVRQRDQISAGTGEGQRGRGHRDGDHRFHGFGQCLPREIKRAGERLIEEPDAARELRRRGGLGKKSSHACGLICHRNSQQEIPPCTGRCDQQQTCGSQNGDECAGGVLQARPRGEISRDRSRRQDVEHIARSGLKVVAPFDRQCPAQLCLTGHVQLIKLGGCRATDSERQACRPFQNHGLCGKAIGIAPNRELSGDQQSTSCLACPLQSRVGGDHNCVGRGDRTIQLQCSRQYLCFADPCANTRDVQLPGAGFLQSAGSADCRIDREDARLHLHG